jgi:hypothetical protein
VKKGSISFLKKSRRPPCGNQKTFATLGSLSPGKPQPNRSEVFCFFFSKKKALLSRFCLNQIASTCRKICCPRVIGSAIKDEGILAREVRMSMMNSDTPIGLRSYYS